MHRVVKKGFCFILWLLYCLVILEILFRVAGYFIYRAEDGISKKEDSILRILCIGDSCTYGIGAQEKGDTALTYPFLLQKIINHKQHQKKAEVVNRGVPGANSPQCVKILETFFKIDNPDIVIFASGVNNKWNYTGFSAKNAKKFLSLSAQWKYKLRSLISKSRIYKGIASCMYFRSFRKKADNYKGRYCNSNTWKKKHIIFNTIKNVSEEAPGGAGFCISYDIVVNVARESFLTAFNFCSDNYARVFYLGYINGEVADLYKNVYEKDKDVFYDDKKSIFIQDLYSNKFISSDGFHPNSLGYYNIAARIYNRFVEEGFFGEGTDKIDLPVYEFPLWLEKELVENER